MQLCLTLTSGTTYLGGTGEISALYKSTDGTYASDIQALVYVDGEYAGEAIKASPHLLDPGKMILAKHLPTICRLQLGNYNINVVIINGAETVSIHSNN